MGLSLHVDGGRPSVGFKELKKNSNRFHVFFIFLWLVYCNLYRKSLLRKGEKRHFLIFRTTNDQKAGSLTVWEQIQNITELAKNGLNLVYCWKTDGRTRVWNWLFARKFRPKTSAGKVWKSNSNHLGKKKRTESKALERNEIPIGANSD